MRTRVGVDLVGDLQLERDDGNGDRRDVREDQKMRLNHLGSVVAVVPTFDINDGFIEADTADLGRHVKANASPGSRRLRTATDREPEVIVELELLSGDQVFGREIHGVGAEKVEIPSRTDPAMQAQGQPDGTFERPPVRCHHDEAGEQPLEDDAFPELLGRHSRPFGVRPEALE